MLRKKAYLLNTQTNTNTHTLSPCLLPLHYILFTFLQHFYFLFHLLWTQFTSNTVYAYNFPSSWHWCFWWVLSLGAFILYTHSHYDAIATIFVLYIYFFLSQFTGIFFVIVLLLKKIKAFESRTTADSLFLISSRHLFGQWFWSIFINNDILIIYHIPHTHLFRVSRPNYEK